MALSKERRGLPAEGEVAAAATAPEAALIQATKTLTGHFPIWASLVKKKIKRLGMVNIRAIRCVSPFSNC